MGRVITLGASFFRERGMGTLTVEAIGGEITQPLRWRLFREYVTVLVVLIGVALVTNGALDLYFWYREERGALTRLQHQRATAAAAEIAHFVNDTRRQLEWAIQPAPLLEPMSNAARRADFSRLLRQAPAITDLYY